MNDSTEEEKQFEIEIAKNARAGCKKCKQKCPQGVLRIAKIVANPFAEGKMKNWHHLDCLFEAFKKQRATTKRIESEDDIHGFDDLSASDKDLVREKIEEICKFFGGNTKSPQKKGKDKKNQHVVSSSSDIDKANNKTSNTKKSEDNLFENFQNIVNKIADRPSYLDKTDIVKKFFTKGSNGTKFEGDIDIWVRMLLPQSEKRIYNLQSKQLVKLFSRIFLEDQDEMLEDLEQGDIAETITKFYKSSKKCKPPKQSTVTIQQIDQFLKHLSKLTKEDDQISHFEQILPKLTPNDLKFIIRLIKHDLRMNAGAKHVLEGIHKDAYDIYKTSKDLGAVIEKCFGNTTNQSADIKILTPVFPMLAEACKSVEYAMGKCPNGMYSEVKYDGERVQVHKYGSEFKYFSRSLKQVLPHKVAHFEKYIHEAFPYANDLILDSEILMMDTKTSTPLPFGTLGIHKKAQFQEATVCLFVFDCLYYNGQSLLQKPLVERKKILEENMKEIPHRVVFSESKIIDDINDLRIMIAEVLKLGLEGLVLKDRFSKYEPSKRHWLKVKKDYLFGGAMADSADLIVLGAWYGTGRKGGIMSVFLMGCYDEYSRTFKTVTKVHTGHDDATLDRLQGELKMKKIGADFDRVPSWLECARTMVPDFVAEDPKSQPVWEITGTEFTQHNVHSADGISIRFPRVTKIRDDKDWKSATNLTELKMLFKKSKESTDVNLLLNNKDSTIINSTKKRKDDSPSNSKNSPKQKKQKMSPTKKNITKPLPNFFENVRVIFSNDNKIETNKLEEIKRYFVAYGGEILTSEDIENVTHFVHVKNYEKGKNMEKYPQKVRHVTLSWIVDSINNCAVQNCGNYVVNLKPD